MLLLFACAGFDDSFPHGIQPADTGFLDLRDDDGDGSPRSADCDDDDPARYVGADEVCGDGVDQDCDGMAAECCPGDAAPLEPRLTVRADGASDYLYDAQVALADADGDGAVDLLVGDPSGLRTQGAAWLVAADADGETTLDAARATWVGTAGDGLGTTVALLPNAAGGADVILGMPQGEDYFGVVCRYDGAARGPVAAEDAVACWTGASAVGQLGSGLDAPGDLDGDGLPDLFLGERGPSDAGIGWLLPGDAPAGDVTDADFASLRGRADSGWSRVEAHGVGDVDGDGFADLLVGWENAEAEFLAHGPLLGRVNADDLVPLPGDSFATSTSGGGPAGDLDGDGYLEVWALATYDNRTPRSVTVWSGPLLESAFPSAVFVGETDTLAATAAASPGDLDGDGTDDLVVAAAASDDALADGRVYAILGAPAGLVDLSCADAHADLLDVPGFGLTLHRGAARDGDGVAELLSVAPDPEDGGGIVLFAPGQLVR